MSIWKAKGRHYIKIMRGGKYVRGGRGYDTREEAELEQAKIRLKLKSSGIQIYTPQCFLNLWHDYLRECKAFHSEDWFKVKCYIGDRYLSQWFGRNPNDISPEEIINHLIKRREKSARSANLDFEILKAFYSWMEQRDKIYRNPFRKGLRKFPLAKKTKIIPDRKEIDRLISGTQGLDRLLVLLLIHTMGRISEILNLRWEDIDLEKGVLYLHTRKTRDGSEKTREIPFGDRLREALSSCETKKGVLLAHHGTPYKDLRRRLHNILKKAGMKTGLGFHAFRHFGATQLADKGVPLNVIQDLLGHTSLNTTNLYLQSLRESKRKAVELLG